jgi:hypothetical protein
MDPTDSLAYFTRSALLQPQGDFAGALRDIDTDLRLPDERYKPYAEVFRHLILFRLGRLGEDNLVKLVPGWDEGWIKKVGLFLTGGISRDQLQKAALESDLPERRKEQVCEAHYFIGMIDMLSRRRLSAKAEFQASLDTGRTGSIEYALAKSELEALKN